jgi:hypothetical protein
VTVLDHAASIIGGSQRTQTNRHFQWSILYLGVIPVTVFVDSKNVVAGYDYFSPNLRTRVVTLYFNTILAE